MFGLEQQFEQQPFMVDFKSTNGIVSIFEANHKHQFWLELPMVNQLLLVHVGDVAEISIVNS